MICVIKVIMYPAAYQVKTQVDSIIHSLIENYRFDPEIMCLLLLPLLFSKHRKNKATEQAEMPPTAAPEMMAPKPVQLSNPYIEPPRRLGIGRNGRRYRDDVRDYGYEVAEKNRRKRAGIAAAA